MGQPDPAVGPRQGDDGRTSGFPHVRGCDEWRLTEYRGSSALELLEKDWKRLYRSMPLRTAFHAYEAHAAYLANLMANPERLRCLVLSDGLKVRLICPLEARTDRFLGIPVRVWGVPWHPHWLEGDVICPEDDARRASLPLLVGHLRRRPEGRSLLVLGPLPVGSVFWTGLRSLRIWEYAAQVPAVPFVFECDRPFDELMSRVSRHFRKELRRCRRRLESLDGVHFETAGIEADIAPLFQDFLEVEGSGWKGESGTGSAIRLHPELKAFYQRLTGGLGDEDGCEINALYAEGRCIAVEFSLHTGEEYATLKIGYDERYARFSPGQILCARTLERCCDDPRIKRFNQLSDADWLRVWHADAAPMQQAHVAIGRWSGPMLVALLQFRFGYGRRVARWVRRAGGRHGPQIRKALSVHVATWLTKCTRLIARSRRQSG